MAANRGFTLIELVATMTVLCLLAGLTFSSIGAGLEAARASRVRADLLTSLRTAIVRAAVTGSHAVLCPSADGQGCSDSFDWSQGWIVFLDADLDRERDEGEARLAIEPALPGRVRLVSSAGRNRIVIQGNGGNAGSNVSFTLCDGRGPGKARALILSNQGRLRDGPPSATGLAACLGQP